MTNMRINMDYDKEWNCWVCKCGQVIPNWNPEQVKFKGKNMLDDEQKEILTRNLTVQLERLENSKDMYVKCIANEGAKLKEILNDITKLKDLLETLEQKDDDES